MAKNQPERSAMLLENNLQENLSPGEDVSPKVEQQLPIIDSASTQSTIAKDTAVVVEKKINARAFSRAPLARKGNIKTQPAKQIQTKH
jgi:hypothetical protein